MWEFWVVLFVRFCFLVCFWYSVSEGGLQFGMPPLGTRRRFLCRVWFVGVVSFALIAAC